MSDIFGPRRYSSDGTIYWEHYLEPGVCAFCEHYVFIHGQGKCRGCKCFRVDFVNVSGETPDV